MAVSRIRNSGPDVDGRNFKTRKTCLGPSLRVCKALPCMLEQLPGLANQAKLGTLFHEADAAVGWIK